MLVYKATNLVNGKVYVGQTVMNLETRRRNHLYAAKTGSPFRFHSAIRKHSPEAFVWEIIFEHDDRSVVLQREEDAIKQLRSMEKEFGYNARPGGTGGWIVPDEKFEEWRAKITLATQGSSNPRYNQKSDEDLLEDAAKICLQLGRVPGIKTLQKMGLRFPCIQSSEKSGFRFGGRGRQWFIDELCRRTGLKYNRYFRSDEQRARLSELSSSKIWITDGKISRHILKDQEIPTGFRRGRCSKSKK